MYARETMNIYCQQDDRWFEPVGRHTPGAGHLSLYRALMPDTWTLRRRGLWFIAEPPGSRLPGQGWKLHVSARAGDGAAALRAALPVLRDRDAHFKFLVDPWSLALTNGKLWPRGSSGKFITVYPADNEEFLAVARELTTALADLTGPYILSDRRCPGSTSVHYRYGGFTGQPKLRADGVPDLMITAPDGSPHPDVRNPYWSAAPWIAVDPFGLDAQRDLPDDSGAEGGLAGGRFEIESAMTFTNRGGVYRALDTRTGRTVVIKEARPHVGLGIGRGGHIDVTDLLEKEHRLLAALSDVEQFVNVVTLFRAWEHLFLVEEYVEGRHLGQVSISANPLYTGVLTGEAFAAYHSRMRELFGQVATAIAAAHSRGIVLADLSFMNVMVDDHDRVRVIDLEGAVQEGIDPSPGLYTPGYSSRRANESAPAAADDYAALGAMMFGSVMLNNSMVGFHPPALPRFLAEFKRDLALPDDLIALISDLTSGTPPEPDTIGKRIAELSVADPAAWPQVLPLGRPASEQLVGERADRLHARIADTVTGVTGYFRRTASPQREDRLFPADLSAYETNPYGVAFGAAGVLRAMHRLSGEVPQELVAWLLRGGAAAGDLTPGLYLGTAGIAWSLEELGHQEAGAAMLHRAAEHPLLWERADVMHGCAGYGLAALRFWQTTGEQRFLDVAARVGAHLATTARRHDAGVSWPEPDGRTPIGYAYGASGVALFLLYLHHATGDPDALRLGRRALDFDLSQARTVGLGLTSFPSYVDDTAEVLRTYWDHGTAGVMTTLVRYVATTGDEGLAAWTDRLIPDLTRKYAVMPQMFHGLSGIGNAMLDAAEFSGRDELFAEASRLAEGVLLFAVERDEGVAFPGEQAMRETCDFATGSSGVALFLDRVLRAGPGRRTNFNFVVDELLPSGGERK
ncbi:class III lanthionine synthetase LanKC [Streptomyces sp. NBC_01622]|uniref:class III lanthionine synthetase LanKC n=1 Tax=Streptomyces sp. NBC_01622 TaxID=2975903 RepID=UPI00386E55CF|nr:class III lanthionine synthetase LanKC [Streptomyces sp. NBC_01622]